MQLTSFMFLLRLMPFINLTFLQQKTFKFLALCAGTYALESKLMGKDRIPYYVWNIWYEVKSGNKENDARIRDEFSE